MDELKAKLDEATRETHALREAFKEYQQLTIQDRQRVHQVEKQATRQKTWLLWAVLGLMLLSVLLFGLNRVTLRQSEDRAAGYIRTVINTCTVGAARLTPDKVAYCETAIPGFSRARSGQAQRALVIDSLERWAKSEGWVPPTTTTLPQ